MALASSERLLAAEEAAEPAFHMDEESFRAFYERTARPLWSYLKHLAGDSALADDLVQESYYRFLRAEPKGASGMSEAYQKNYLFRIATNLARDHWRRSKPAPAPLADVAADPRTAEDVERRSDLERALAKLKPRERQLLWLAHVEGSSHEEIAAVAGLRRASIRLLLFRARRKLAHLLRKQGVESSTVRS